jgi:hypothetical protein
MRRNFSTPGKQFGKKTNHHWTDWFETETAPHA